MFVSLFQMHPPNNSDKPTRKLLRKPRRSRRPPPSASSSEGPNEEQLGDDFHFVDGPVDYDFIHDDEEEEDAPYDIYQAPIEKFKSGKHKTCLKKSKSDIEKQLMLDSRLQTATLVKPRLPRGPENFPCRPLHRMSNLLYDILWDEDDFDYYQVPAFTLNDFLYQIAAFSHAPVQKVKETVFSKHNYKKLTRLLAEQNAEKCTSVSKMDFKDQCMYILYHKSLQNIKILFFVMYGDYLIS